MLVEDLHLRCMPIRIGRASADDKVSIKLDPPNQAIERSIAESLTGREYEPFEDAVCSFMRDACQSLALYGRITFEIVIERDDQGQISSFEFDSVYPPSVWKIFGSFYQIIPWWRAKNAHCRVGIRKIPSDKVLSFEIPKELGGKRGWIRMLSRLYSFRGAIIPPFQMRAMEKNVQTGFNFEKFVQLQYLEKSRAVKHIGWNQRKWQDSKILEYYAMVKSLRFAYCEALIREAIHQELNLALAGKRLNLENRIVIDGAPKSEDILKEMEALERGDLGFVELMNRVSI